MKIAFDHQIFTNQEVGGISRYYWELANQLDLLGQEIAVFAGFYQNRYLDNTLGLNIKGKKVTYPSKSIRLFQTINSFMTHKQIKSWRPDIVHETYYSNSLFPKYVLPRVITVHDMIHELYKEDFKARHLISEQKLKSIERANHVICISNSTKNDLMDLFGIEEGKISVIYHGVNCNDFYSDNNSKKTNYRPFLLYVGQRKGYKNFNTFIEAFANSKLLSNEFDVIAFGGESFDQNELNKFKEINLASNQVRHIVGEDSVLKNLYSRASAFVYPSLYEGFGFPPLEAMASGCPVISSFTSSMPEVIGSAAEYFDPTDVESVKYAMENVIYSKDLQNELINMGYENVKKFTWKKCAVETLSVYNNFAK